MFLKTLLLFHVIYIYGRNIFPFITRSFRFNETTDIDEISLLFIVVLWMHKKRSALDTPFLLVLLNQHGVLKREH